MKVAFVRRYMSFRSEQMVQREQNDDALSVLRSYPFC